MKNIIVSVVAILAALPAVSGNIVNTFQSRSWRVSPMANSGVMEKIIGSHEVHIPDVNGLRLHFHPTHLGVGNYLKFTYGKEILRMNDAALRSFHFSTPYLNSDRVKVEMVVAGKSRTSGISLKEVEAPRHQQFSTQTICGPTDDRVLTSFKPFARMLRASNGSGGCTGTLVSPSCMISAGHCTAALNVAQFNVPSSKPSGAPNYPNPKDQYALERIVGSSNYGPGSDWAVYKVRRNPITGQLPGHRQGYLNVLLSAPAKNANLQITGYGSDRSRPTRNGAQQTHYQKLVNIVSSSAMIAHSVDTEPGNSGASIIDRFSGKIIGVHTHGGCSRTGGANYGTALMYQAEFRKALADCMKTDR